MKTQTWLFLCGALSIACKPSDELPSPAIGGTGDNPGDSSSGGSAYDETAYTGPLDDTAGGGGGTPCDPDSAEFVCRGFAVGVYLGPDGTETIEPGGMIIDRCIDPVDSTAVDPDDTYQDVRMCAPWHGIATLQYENPGGASEEAIRDDLAERCRARCEAEVSFPAGIAGHTLDRVECIITIDDVGYGDSVYNPDCSYSELLRVDHGFPRHQAGLDEEYKPCSLESCSMAACSDYDPIGGVGLTRGLRASRAVIHRGLLDELRVEPFALWECDPGRYAESITSAGDPARGVPAAVTWRFEALEPGGLLYELGLRNGDANARVWAQDPVTGAATSKVFALDSVEGLADAYDVLFGGTHVTLEVERSRAGSTIHHRILVSVEDCGLDLDGDGDADVVRCANP